VLKPGDTNGFVDPFNKYNPDGTSDNFWSGACGISRHLFLFRPDGTYNN
jgi:hypothetical protein